jgi:eukaryotic-like serine/threonine-protein kinase
MNDFLRKLWENIKYFGREAGYFFSSKIFWIKFGKILLYTFGFLFLMFWGLKCFTRHNSSVLVGNYVGKSIKEALRDADSKGFDIVVTDSIFREGFAADLVLEQEPSAGSAVKEGRTIYLKITKASGDLVTLPDVAGQDINTYVRRLLILGIKPGRIDTVLDAQDFDGAIRDIVVNGRSVYQNLKQGVRVPQGGYIDFVISKTTSDERIVEDIVCKTADEATIILGALGLKTDYASDASVTEPSSAFVTRQSPTAGDTLKKGAVIRIFLSQNRPAHCGGGADQPQ